MHCQPATRATSGCPMQCVIYAIQSAGPAQVVEVQRFGFFWGRLLYLDSSGQLCSSPSSSQLDSFVLFFILTTKLPSLKVAKAMTSLSTPKGT